MRFRRMITVGTSVVALSAMTAGPALAHFCYNASRSDQGNQRAGSQSQAWYTIDLFEEMAWELEDDDLLDCAWGQWLDQGGIPSLTIMVKGAKGQDGVIAGRNPNLERHHDGRGIDHVDFGMIVLFDTIIAQAPETCGEA